MRWEYAKSWKMLAVVLNQICAVVLVLSVAVCTFFAGSRGFSWVGSDESFESVESCGAAQAFVTAPVDELQHLHGEFHIAQAAFAQFDLTIFEVERDEAFDALAHGSAFVHKVRPRCSRPHVARGHLRKLLGESVVACDRASFEKSLELPILRPFTVVSVESFESAHEWAIFAFGAQGGVDIP